MSKLLSDLYWYSKLSNQDSTVYIVSNALIVCFSSTIAKMIIRRFMMARPIERLLSFIYD